jgi:hypothetical protein
MFEAGAQKYDLDYTSLLVLMRHSHEAVGTNSLSTNLWGIVKTSGNAPIFKPRDSRIS